MNEEDYYVCGICGGLVSKMQGEVHDNFHSETRTGAIQLPDLPLYEVAPAVANKSSRKNKKRSRRNSR